MFKIVRATKKDLPAITEIYNEAILNSTATFDTEPKSESQQLKWFEGHQDRHPIYVSKDFRNQGIGKALLAHLDQQAPELNFHTLISKITAESEISIHLHERLSFERVGILKEVGRKFDRQLDVLLMQKVYSK